LISACVALVFSAAFNPVTDCGTYCGAIAANTSACGNNFISYGYLDMGACITFCSAMGAAVNTTSTPPYNFGGDTTNTSGNTMGCRLNRLLTNNASLCAGASIHGGGICGGTIADLCGTYCTAQAATCPETFSGTYVGYLTPPTGFQGAYCAQSCLTVGASWTIDTAFPLVSATNFAANTLTCRIYHTNAAYNRTVPNTFHCTHATYLGGGVCVGSPASTSETTNFCNQVFANCPSNNPYTSMAQCLSDSLTYNTSTIAIATAFGASAVGDNLACRFYHASYPSFSAPATHCPHTGWSSAVCTNNGTVRPVTPAPTVAAPTTASGNQGVTTSKPNSAISLIASLALIVLACVVALF